MARVARQLGYEAARRLRRGSVLQCFENCSDMCHSRWKPVYGSTAFLAD